MFVILHGITIYNDNNNLMVAYKSAVRQRTLSHYVRHILLLKYYAHHAL